jgi:hypothetical protein
VKVRFLADADLNKAIVSGVLRREPSLDFLNAQAAGLRGTNDPEVLALAAEQHRVLVSHDVGTMPAHFRVFRSAGKRSAGVFLVPQSLDIGTARRTPAHLAGIGSVRLGGPAGVATALTPACFH